MKYIKLNNIDEKILYDKLDNGLEVFIIRKKDFNSYSARFFTNFGSLDTEFIPINEKKYVKMPTGVAHFLEHKLFETSEKENVHDFYKKSGTSVNAFTNYEKTCYYIYGTKNFYENLEYLLDFVQNPYFTDKNVEKEKGIIKEEALMNLDDSNRIFNEKILENLFVNIPYNEKIVGSIDDIDKITKEDLYTCYNTFYHPSNMKLMVVSNEKEEKVLKIIRDNQLKKDYDKNIKIIKKSYNEKLKIKKDYEILEERVNEQRLCYSIKLDKNVFNSKNVVIYDSISIMLCYLIGGLSSFNLKLKKDNLIKDNIGFSIDFINEFVIIYIYALTDNEKEFIKLLEKEFKNINISEEDFNNFKKVIKSSFIYTLNSVNGTIRFLYNEYIFNNEINPKNIDLENNLKYDEFLSIIKNIDFSNKSIVVLKPLQK